MLKKGLAVFLMALLAAPLFADVELSTSINDVFNKGTDELAGSITMRVNADDFNNASTSEPVFIRITLDHQAKLADTLVDIPNGNDRTEDPIYLAMTLNTTNGNFSLMSSPDAVSIVRWVEGESAFWVRVQDDSSDWISLNDVTDPLFDPLSPRLAPRDELTVSWTIGISARNSHEDMDNIQDRYRNLPFNTRNEDGTIDRFSADTDDATSTLICVDLEDGNLQSISESGVESLLNFDPIAFDETSESSLGVYRPGTDTGINFTNDFAIARGKRRACTVDVDAPKADAPSKALCVDDPGENFTVNGWVYDTNTIIFTIDCERGGDFLDTDMYDGAYVRFSTAGDTYGFKGSGDATSSATATTRFSGGFTDSAGETTYRTMDVVWADGFYAINSLEWSIDVRVWRWYLDGAVDVDLNWSLVLVNHDGAEDTDDTAVGGEDWSGDDQHRRCEPSEFTVDTGTWNWGEFVECTGNPAVLFFPYLPMLRGNDLFWSGLSVVNHGGVDFEQLDVMIYQEDGSRFDAVLPALAQNNQYTWLLVYDEEAGTIGFNGMGDHDGTLVTPTPYDAEDSIDDFGVYRMSMFVVGNYEAEFNQEADAGDLDGYLLIGKNNDIDGSYLPRNMEGDGDSDDRDHRHSDLPPMAKRGADAPAAELFKTRPATYRFINGRIQN